VSAADRELAAAAERAARFADPERACREEARVRRILERAASLTEVESIASWLRSDEVGGWRTRVKNALKWVAERHGDKYSPEQVDEETAHYMLLQALEAELRRAERLEKDAAAERAADERLAAARAGMRRGRGRR